MAENNLTATLKHLAYRDYIAARCLLNNGYIIQGLTLTSTAIEKYLKMPLAKNDNWPFIHLSDLSKLRRAYEKAGYNLTEWVPDSKFLELICKVYEIRYYTKTTSPVSVGCFPGQVLGELDYMVAAMEISITVIDNDTGLERISPYKRAVAKKDEGLYLNNYFLNNLDKTTYMEQEFEAYALHVDISRYGSEFEVVGRAKNKYEGEITLITVNA